MPGWGDLLSVLAIGFVSALVPVLNIEAYLGVRGSVAALSGIWILGFAAGLGQMVGKLVWYYLGANALSWGWLRRKVDTPSARERLARWRTRTQDRPVLAGVLVFVSAVTGIPPLALVAVIAGQLRMQIWLFAVLAFTGRGLRFAAILSGVQWLTGWLH